VDETTVRLAAIIEANGQEENAFLTPTTECDIQGAIKV
jgi:hypothetical protein